MTGFWLGGAALLVGAFAWRFASRRRHLPCPSLLFWILDNPYTAAVAGAELILDRAEVLPGMRVLDVGAGPGRVAVPAAQRVGPHGEVVAMDVQEDMLARVRAAATKQGLQNIITVAGSIENGFPGAGDFDRALLITVLGEIPDRAAAMRALYAALGFGGLLSVTEMGPDPHYQSRSTVRHLAESAGFAYERSFGNSLAYTTNYRKPAG